jgi:hypothetical protein
LGGTVTEYGRIVFWSAFYFWLGFVIGNAGLGAIFALVYLIVDFIVHREDF